MVVLFIFFFGLFHYFSTPEQPADPSEIDSIKVKMSATKRTPSQILPRAALPKLAEAPVQTELIEEDDQVQEEPTEHYDDEDQLAHVEEIPWNDIKAGWKESLQEYLGQLDPVYGEDIYKAYQEENSSYESEIEAITRAGEENGADPQEIDHLVGQLEVKHEQRLKDIFGHYYKEVTDFHHQYNTSLEYYSRTPGSRIGVSL